MFNFLSSLPIFFRLQKDWTEQNDNIANISASVSKSKCSLDMILNVSPGHEHFLCEGVGGKLQYCYPANPFYLEAWLFFQVQEVQSIVHALSVWHHVMMWNVARTNGDLHAKSCFKEPSASHHWQLPFKMSAKHSWHFQKPFLGEVPLPQLLKFFHQFLGRNQKIAFTPRTDYLFC